MAHILASTNSDGSCVVWDLKRQRPISNLKDTNRSGTAHGIQHRCGWHITSLNNMCNGSHYHHCYGSHPSGSLLSYGLQSALREKLDALCLNGSHDQGWVLRRVHCSVME